MIETVRGHLMLQKYGQFVKTLYAETKDEVIASTYLTKTNLSVVQANDGFRARRKKKNTQNEVKSKDIREMLKNNFCTCIMKYYI